MNPNDIAEIISEDISINNGVIFEDELPAGSIMPQGETPQGEAPSVGEEGGEKDNPESKDLLAACKEALEYFGYLRRFHAGYGDFADMPSFSQTEQNLARAIAKAEYPLTMAQKTPEPPTEEPSI